MAQSGFNPKARWDRNLPQDVDSIPDSLDERIDVIAWFKNARIYPRLFFWKDRKYKVKKITYNWQERLGREILFYFSLDTGVGLFQVSFNNVTLAWRINKVIG